MIVVLAGAALVWIVAALFGADSREGRDWEWNARDLPLTRRPFERALSLRRGRPSERCSQ